MTSALLDEARRHDAAMTADHPTCTCTGAAWCDDQCPARPWLDRNHEAGIWFEDNRSALLDAHEQALGEVERLTAALTELRTALVGVPIIKCADVVFEIDAILKGAP